MRSLEHIEACLDQDNGGPSVKLGPRDLLELGEEILEHWLLAKSVIPTSETSEGFRLLALQRQGARGNPSFNACRESCRELVYHYNLLCLEPDGQAAPTWLKYMRQLVLHIFYFVTGKMQSAQLGEFCCSSRTLRVNDEPRGP